MHMVEKFTMHQTAYSERSISSFFLYHPVPLQRGNYHCLVYQPRETLCIHALRHVHIHILSAPTSPPLPRNTLVSLNSVSWIRIIPILCMEVPDLFK